MMKADHLLDAIGEIQDTYIADALPEQAKKGRHPIRWAALAASLVLVVAGSILLAQKIEPQIPSPNTQVSTAPPLEAIDQNHVLQWSEDFAAADYFKYNGDRANGDHLYASTDVFDGTGLESRRFSGRRAEMEQAEMIPSMENYPLFLCSAIYNEDESIVRLTYSWSIRGDLDQYSDLAVSVFPQEPKTVKDYQCVELDESGNVIEPTVTVTQRDGCTIVAEGRENQDKSLTFERGGLWYRIEGSYNDSCAAVAELLDWFWEHPVNLSDFPMEAGDDYTHTSLKEVPDLWAEYIPDFESLGYAFSYGTVTYKNGVPVGYEGHYEPGFCYIVDAEPDYYTQLESLGNLWDLTDEEISAHERQIVFTLDSYYIKIHLSPNVSNLTTRDLLSALGR